MIIYFKNISIRFVRSPEDYGGRMVNGHWNGILSLFEEKVYSIVRILNYTVS